MASGDELIIIIDVTVCRYIYFDDQTIRGRIFSARVFSALFFFSCYNYLSFTDTISLFKLKRSFVALCFLYVFDGLRNFDKC